MIFGNDKKDHIFTFNEKNLEIVNNYKYLGVIINSVKNSRGNIFKDMWQYTADKGLKACFAT